MKKTISILLIIFQLCAVGYYAYLRIHNSRHIKEPRSFGDTTDYFHNASLPVLSKDFWIDARPPVTALFWKVVNSDPKKIYVLQFYFSILSWAILAFASTSAVKSSILKPLVFVIVLGFSLSRDIIMWDPFLGSESIALSFTALFLASAIWLFLEWKNYKLALLIVAALFMVFTRDTYAYLLVMIAVVSIPVFWFTNYRSRVVAVGFSFLVIFALSSQLAVLGLRPFRAVVMNTALRIFPSETYTEYFRSHGMPIDNELVETSRNIQPGKKFAVYFSLFSGENNEDYRQWAMKSGSSEYAKFLWFFKVDTLQKVFTETAGQSFFPDVYYYTATGYKPIIKDARISEFLYPTRFGLFFFFAATFGASFFAAIAWRDKRALWFIPLLMILLTYPQAVLVWAADVNDIARHSISHNVLLRLGVWILAFFILDVLFENLSARMPFMKKSASPA
ncbi:MAG: hypothetical protein U0Z26_17830 [Anaerolineales bacterium]